MNVIEHTSTRTFASYSECMSAIEWIILNLYKSGSEDMYQVVQTGEGFKYIVTSETKESSLVLFDNQKLLMYP